MPTPNVARSRSPVAISASCLPEEIQSRRSRLGRSSADETATDSDAVSKLVAGVEMGEDVAAAAAAAAAAIAAGSSPSDVGAMPAPSNWRDASTRTEGDASPSHSSSSISSSVSSDSEISLRASTESPTQQSHVTPFALPTKSSAAETPSRPSSRSTSSSLSPALQPADWEVASKRVHPLVSSSFFRPFAKFVGSQKSDKQVYNVEVELKYVDMAQSFCCGYLQIEGLTANLPVITTYFEGEIIGTNYGFHTRHDSWGASEKTDMAHWSRFAAFAPLKAAVKAGRHHDPDFASRDFLFMRWKEHFLVSDHRQRSLDGASFEGFYYIVFDQVKGAISGIYYHSKSEKFQRLDLSYQHETWCPPAFEFR